MDFQDIKYLRRRTITRDLTVGLALTIALVVVAVGVFNYSLSVQKIEQELDRRATDIIEKLSTTLALPLWNIEEGEIQKIAHVYMDMDNVVALRIVDEDQRVVVDERVAEETDVIVRQRRIDHEGHTVGSVDVALTRRSIGLMKQRILFSTFAIMFFVILAVVIAIRILLKKYLNRPLDKLTEGIAAIAGGRYDHRLTRVAQWDVNEIVEAVNVMAEAIQSREDRLQKAKQSLEQSIEARTVQLRTANKQLRVEAAERGRAEKMLRSVTDNSLDYIMLLDLDGTVQFINRTVPDLTIEQVIGTPCFEYVPEAYRETVRDCFARVIETAGPDRYETEYRDEDGIVFTFESRVSPVIQDGKVVALSQTATDITERKNTEAVLKQAKEAAEAAARARSQFLANMSHEIRTPMNGVIGMTSLLLSTGLSGEQREYVEVVRSSGDALLTIINDILDFSKIEAGRIELEEHPFDLRACVSDAVDLLAKTAREKDLRLVCLVDPDVPATVVTDSTRLRQIIVNLVSNAVKFTANGEVTVSVCAERGEAGSYRFQFSIRDTGIGIAPAQLDRLFQPFIQADASTTRRYGGTGLGLSICKKLCQLLGGDVGVESEPGVGSTFHFTITAHAVAESAATAPAVATPREEDAPPASKQSAPEASVLHILLAEDNVVNQKVAMRMLERLGYRADVVADGQEAVEALYRQRYDVVLMDVQMPQMDGLEATRCVRAELPAERQPYIVALTANAMKGDRERCLAAGMDDYLSKPVKLDALGEALARCRTASVGAAPDAPPVTRPRPSTPVPRRQRSAP